MDQLFCMRVFTRVVEQNSFVRAAENLAVSAATVTTAIAQLEQHLGSRLLQRTTRRLSLTDEGRRYYRNCIRILDDIAEAEETLSGGAATPRGTLRVSVPQSFSHLPFFPAIEQFMRANPQLSVEILLTDRSVNLVEEGIDCAVRGTEIPGDSLLVARHLAVVHRTTCASPEYLAARGEPDNIRALAQHECVRFISPVTGRTSDWQFMENGKKAAFTPQGRLAVTSFEAAVAAAEAGSGVIQVPEPLVYRQIFAGKLRPLLVSHVVTAPPLVVVYPGSRYIPAKVRAFADFMATAFPSKGWWPEISTLPAQGSAQPSPGKRIQVKEKRG